MMQEKSPKISLVVPVYNSEKYLHRCIDSILAQTFTDFELLLIDDGSTDKSGKISDDYANLDKRVKVFHKKNGGVSSARNLGLDNASGDFVWFIDSDDWIQNMAMQFLLQKMSALCPDIIFFSFNLISKMSVAAPYTFDLLCKDNTERFYGGRANCAKAIVEIEKCGGMGWTWNKVFRRSIIQNHNIRFDTRFAIQEDHLFTFSYLKHVNSILIINHKLYNYGIEEGSLINRKYPFVNTKERNDAMYENRCELCRIFHITNAEYVEWFTTDYASRNIANLVRLKDSDLSKVQRKEEILKVNAFLKTHRVSDGRICKYKRFNWLPCVVVLLILSKLK